MQREAALKGEAVEGAPSGIRFSGDAILALIEKRAGLLAFKQIHGKAHAAFCNRELAGVCAVKHAGGARQAFEVAHPCFVALDDGARAVAFNQ